jgi:hypothetical protein
LLQRRKTRFTDGFPVTRLMLLEQAAAYQKPKAAKLSKWGMGTRKFRRA